MEDLFCPLCNSKMKVSYIGNDRTKSRKIHVKCSNSECRIERTDGTIRYDFQWLENVVSEFWSRRTLRAPDEATGCAHRAVRPAGSDSVICDDCGKTLRR